MPDIEWSPPIVDLFSNLQNNFETLTPVFSLLFGILFIFFVLRKVKKMVWGGDDEDD